jgi:hypothetical protein
MRFARQGDDPKLRRLRTEVEHGLQDAEANRFSKRTVAEIARSVLDEMDTATGESNGKR